MNRLDNTWDLQQSLPFEDSNANGNPNKCFATNAIKTTKYSLWSFIPKNLFQQFHRSANVYFVMIDILNFVPFVSAFQPTFSLVPLSIIVSVTAVKDAWEDFRRYQSDKEINNMRCWIFSRSDSMVTRFFQLGDFVRLACNEIIPADLLLLHTSEQNGSCNIETSNLDGETNLKQRRAVKGFAQPVRTCFFQFLTI
uniref:ATPase phospholipid transporting 10B (putative) n=1 Tax=Callorhinchus milii TaxID=7868 RepID=A0A4W3HIG5_CALMI